MYEDESKIIGVLEDLGCHLSIYYVVSLFVWRKVIRLALISTNALTHHFVGSVDRFCWCTISGFVDPVDVIQNKR